MFIFRSPWARILIALYFSATFILALLTRDEPPPASFAAFLLSPIAPGLLLAAFHAAAYLVILSMERPRGFLIAFASGGAFILASIVASALAVYPDLLRSTFHAAGALILIFVFKRDRLPFIDNRKDLARVVLYFLAFLEAGVLIWVILHAYHGIILGAPATKQWIVFNLYTAGYLFLGLVAILYTRRLMRTRVLVTGDRFLVDENDCTPLFGRSDLLVMRLFARSRERRVTCADILREAGSVPSAASRCGRCVSGRHKATLCADYRRIYNQVLKTKKILESLRIGTILQPGNKMNVTREGWWLELFQHVDLRSRDG